MIDWRDPDGRPATRVTLWSALRWGGSASVVAAVFSSAVWLSSNWERAVAAQGDPPPAYMVELAPLSVAPEIVQHELPPSPKPTVAQLESEYERQRDITPPPKPQLEMPPTPTVERAEAMLEHAWEYQEQNSELSKEKPEVTNSSRDSEQQQAEEATAPIPLSSPKADRSVAPTIGSGVEPPQSAAAWRSNLFAHLNRFKRFPRNARGAGAASIAFTIDQAGNVIDVTLTSSSGDAALDDEALAMPRRASPIPTPPANIGGGSEAIRLNIPIRFTR